MDADDLEITPTNGPSCEGVRDLIVELLAAHSLVTSVGPLRDFMAQETGLRTEIGGLGFDIWIEPA